MIEFARKPVGQATRQKISRALKNRKKKGGKKSAAVKVADYLVKGRGSGETRLGSAGRGALRGAALASLASTAYNVPFGAWQGGRIADSVGVKGPLKGVMKGTAAGTAAIKGAQSSAIEGAALGGLIGAATHRKPKSTRKKK